VRRAFLRHRNWSATSGFVLTALLAMLITAPSAGAGVLNSTQLDNGVCGQNLQLGSNITASNTATPSFLLAGDGALSSYSIKIDGVSIGTFNSDRYSQVCILTTAALSNGTHTLTGSELAPNPANAVPSFAFTVDTVAPSPPSTPALDPSGDSGVKGDGVTNMTNLRMAGTSEAGLPIHVMEGPTMVGGTMADSTGHWSVTTTSRSTGTHTLYAVALDSAANVSAPSGSMSVTVDNVAPAVPPAPGLDPASDTAPAGDNTTTMTTPTIAGTGEPGATMRVYIDTVFVGTTAANSSGSWQFRTATLAVGLHAVTASAMDAAGNLSAQSSPLSLTIGAASSTVPSAPTASVGAGNASVPLSWNTPANGGSTITGYRIYRSTTSGAETLYTSVGVTNAFTDTAVANGTTYYYQVTALNGVGESARSTQVSATPVAPATVPGTPTASATAGTGSVTLNWTVPSNGGSALTGFIIYRGTVSGTETAWTIAGPGTSNYLDTNVVNGTKYFYQVSALNNVGEGARSNETSATSTAATTAPSPPSLSGSAGNASATLSWTTPADGGNAITGYRIYRGTSSGTETLLTTVGLVNGYADTTVTNGSSYYYQVSAVNGVGESARSNELLARPATTPGTPALTTSAGNATVALQWSVPANGGSAITGYRIYRGSSTGAETLFTSVGAVNTYTDTTVSNGGTYYYQVTALNSIGEGSRSNETVARPATLPSAPSLSATGSTMSVALTWNAPANGGATIGGYRIYRSTTSGAEALLVGVGATTSYTDSAVVSGTTYFYQVTAVNNVGESARSNEASATPAASATVPGAPALSATAGNGSATLTWTAPANGGSAITGYRVYRSTSTGTETLFTSVGTTTSYTDTAVVNATTYYYQVTALNGVGEGARSNETSARPTAPASAPSAPTSSASAGNATVALTWNAPADGGSAITGYRVYRSTSTGTETLFASVGPSTTTFTDNTVTNGVTYFYQVTALNSVGEGARSNETSARPTAPATVPGAPTCSLKVLTKSGMRVSWTVPPDGGSAITGYRVYRSTSSGAETLLTSVAASATSYTDSATTRGVVYYYRVAAVNAYGTGPMCAEVNATAR
jgi:fibronectin type 3 domain-containing protein